MSWDTIRNLAVLGMFDDRSGYQVAMNVIQCFSALRKSWHHYKYAKPDSDIAWRILRLQKSMNLTLAKFEELDMQQARHDLKLEFDGYRQQIDSEVEEE